MEPVEAVLLGVLQGLLEWLPVSSSGQLTVFYALILGLDPVYAYRLSLASHFGTALSAMIYYRGILSKLASDSVWFRVLVVPTVIALPVGYIVYQYIINVDPVLLEVIVGLSLIATGAILKLQPERQAKLISNISNRELLLVGLMEGFSAVPGISRSAITISTLTIMRYNAADSVKASFIMAIPVTLAASIHEATGLAATGYGISVGSFVLVLVSSLVAGLASIRFMMIIAEKLSSKIPAFLVILGSIIVALYIPLFL